MIDAEKELAKIAAAGAEKPSGKRPAKAPAAGTLRLRLARSGICTPKDQKNTLKGLGLRRLHQSVVRPDSPAIRGMVHKVRHLVEIEGKKD